MDEAEKSPHALAVEAGLSPRYVQDLLDGSKQSFSAAKAKQFADKHGYCTEWILYGTGPKKPDEATADVSEFLDFFRRRLSKQSQREVIDFMKYKAGSEKKDGA